MAVPLRLLGVAQSCLQEQGASSPSDPSVQESAFVAAVSTIEPTRDVICPMCGGRRRVSGRHARRSPVCSLCRHPAKIKAPEDKDRRFWLERFSDDEILDIAHGIFDKEGDLATIQAWRSHLIDDEEFVIDRKIVLVA